MMLSLISSTSHFSWSLSLADNTPTCLKEMFMIWCFYTGVPMREMMLSATPHSSQQRTLVTSKGSILVANKQHNRLKRTRHMLLQLNNIQLPIKIQIAKYKKKRKEKNTRNPPREQGSRNWTRVWHRHHRIIALAPIVGAMGIGPCRWCCWCSWSLES